MQKERAPQKEGWTEEEMRYYLSNQKKGYTYKKVKKHLLEGKVPSGEKG